MNNEDNILTSIKHTLGLTQEYTPFDLDIVMHINSVFVMLNQMGIGPKMPFKIKEDEETSWDEFIQDQSVLEAVKSYMAAKVRIMFDPPQSSIVFNALNNIISELEWRLNVACDVEEDGDAE